MSKRSPSHTLASFFILATLAAGFARGQSNPGTRRPVLPDFDIRGIAGSADPAGAGDAARARTMVGIRRSAFGAFTARTGVRAAVNRHGLPRLLAREGVALTVPSSRPAEEIAKTFLRDHAAIYPFDPGELDGLRLVVNDAAGSATHLVFNQTAGGIDVFDGQIKFTLSKAGEVIQVATGDVAPGLVLSTTPRLAADAAISAARTAAGPGASAAALSRVPELTVFPLNASSARLAYRVFLEVDAERYYEILIDAENGRLLFRHNLYVHAGRAQVWKKSPIQGSREEVTFPDGWLPATAVVTTGNNADAYLDADGNGRPDVLSSPDFLNGHALSVGQVFDFPFGDGMMEADPRQFQAAAVTNLFYLINVAHDYLYGLGFTEAAGNFQTDNFSKGGKGNDAVAGQAQSSAALNNASFAVTPDGTAPRLRVGLFTRGTKAYTDDLDGDYDGLVVIHEYAHGLSNRLVGGGTSTSCLSGLQSGAMGEGWSDYFAGSFYGDPVMGAYVTQNSIRGIRRHSYEGYAYTYEDIGNQGYEVHNDGEIWAAALWDLRKSLGQSITDRLVVDGLKATPCSPSMTDARDAILASDLAANLGANRAVIWQVFARHGMGYSAVGVDGDDFSGTRYDAAYDLPPDMQPVGSPAITSDPLSIQTGMGDVYRYAVTATNPNGGTLHFALDSGPAGMTIDPATGVLSWLATFVGERVEVTVTDGKGGRVVHGFFLPVLTRLAPTRPTVIGGGESTYGYAYIDVPEGVPALQVALRGGLGDADLMVLDPGGALGWSEQGGNTETVTFPNPAPGQWLIGVFGYLDYSRVALTAALLDPPAVPVNTTVPGLEGLVGSETLYKVTVPSGALSLAISTAGGEGDVDLYVRKGKPAVCSELDVVSEPCLADDASESSGTAESVVIDRPAPGDWYFDLAAYDAYRGVTLTVSVSMPGLNLSPVQLSFNAAEASVTPAAGAISIATLDRAAYVWTARASTESAGQWLSIGAESGSGNSALTVIANPAGLATGVYRGSVLITAPELAGSPQTVAVTLTVFSSPVLWQGGVAGAGGSAMPVTEISPGALVSIYGAAFAPPGTARGLEAADLFGGILPTRLADVCVDVDNKPAYLFYVSPGQINFQAPALAVDQTVDVVVRSHCFAADEVRSAPVPVRVRIATPEFLYWTRPADGKFPVVAVDALTGSYIGTAGLIPDVAFAPATPGEVLTIYGVSFGPTDPAYAPGEAPAAAGATLLKPGVRLGSADLSAEDILYAGVSPETAGLYQLNIRVPQGIADGVYPLVLSLGDYATPAGYLAIHR
jgi:uncharacterized protein (TIGR03437 family)